MSRRRSLARRDRGLAYANPMKKDALQAGVVALAVGAGIGAGLGAIGGAQATPPDPMGGALSGGSVGVGLTSMGGFIYGLISPEHRNAGFATAGLGLLALFTVNVVANVSSAGTAKSTAA